VLLTAGCAHEPPLQRFNYAQIKMGVQARLVVYAFDEATAVRACTAAFQRIAQLDDICSDYRPTSELLRLCARAGTGPVPVSDELFYVLSKSRELSRQTDGAFDVTVGPAVALWRSARKTRQLPTTQAVESARALVDWRFMHLDGAHKTVTLDKPAMRLDLGGIAKGYAGDEALAVLKRYGITRALFEAGGDIVLGEPPPHESGWPIELENPGAAPPKLVLHHCAISTSGDTVQFVEINGARYSHVIDPRTARALTNRAMATVIAKKGIDADSLSTAVTVMPPDAARALARAYGATLYLRQDAQ
jgi:FAD:protein FMN transferase